jgi:hypothetical protein
MGDNLENAVNSLSEQTKKINIALFYTGNDMEKAKQMVAGSYKDVLALKIKFTSSSLYGAMIVFLNASQVKLVDSFLVVSNDYLIDNIQNTQDWKTFEKDISSSRAGVTDYRLINEIKDKFDRGFTIQTCTAIIKLFEKNDPIQLSRSFQKFVQETTGLQRVDISLEIQKISSLEMELDSVSTRKMDSLSAPEKVPDEPVQVETASEDEVKAGVNGVRAVIRSSLILSPIKGKNISELKINDKVMISLIDLNDQNITIAKAFNAFDAENRRILPIPARLKAIKFIEGTGYKIFVVIAKGIIGQIIEEETNIKVALDPSVPAVEETADESGGKTSLWIIIALFAAILTLVGVILAMVLK